MADTFDFDQFEDAPEMAEKESKVASQEFNFDEFDDADQNEETPKAQAALEGFTQGLSFGFGDEIAGVSEAAGQALGIEGLSRPAISTESGKLEFFPETKLSEEGPTMDLETLLSAYREGRDYQREKQKKAEEDQPGTYLAADLAGGLAIPGAALASSGKAALNAAKVPVMKSAAKRAALGGAALGAVESAGRTENDITSKEALDDVELGALRGDRDWETISP